MDAEEFVFHNPLMNDLNDTFGNLKIEPAVKLKIKKNRRKHLKDLNRFKKLGVLIRSSSSINDSHNGNQRKMSEKLLSKITIFQPVEEESEENAKLIKKPTERDFTRKATKRNSYNIMNILTESPNTLLKYPTQNTFSNVSEERSSGLKDSQNNYSNGHQGTRIDSPQLNKKSESKGDNQVDLSNKNKAKSANLFQKKPKAPLLKIRSKKQKQLKAKLKENFIANKTQRAKFGKAKPKNFGNKNNSKYSSLKMSKKNLKLQSSESRIVKNRSIHQDKPDQLDLRIYWEQQNQEEMQGFQVGSGSPVNEGTNKN